ncbi:site-specific DNA-methyltransferase [Arthrobacter echini]|uniref:Methyltransferase n=1 Tax=Arthrobacter echini TaxID=1529066 RepID=A0A5D0XV93_9MICC|nr:site-specific DNA-methyltransferase [Arthrobacter echini]TYC99911.1 site-specific DNA-methyltransferase [Arthrobacter echini]
MSSRAEDFQAITASIASHATTTRDHAIVALGDSLALLERLPDASVSLILTDPPYHSTKKDNIYGDRSFIEDEHFLEWMEKFAVQWKRILKPNGTAYVFCSAQMSARLEVMMSQYLRPLNHITWTKPNAPGYDGWKGKMNKEALRRWYPHSERILVFEHGTYGAATASRRSPMGQYLMETRKRAGMSGHRLTELTGAYGKVNHGGAVANWEAGRNIPSRNQYKKMVDALEATGKIGKMLAYEDIIRPMDVHGGVEFTDVWDFMSVRPFKGKHPAEKPLDMLRHVVSASSYPGDIVLDCFAGSGSTGVAALQLGRRAVCIDIEEQWTDRMSRDLRHIVELESSGDPARPANSRGRNANQLHFDSLFD